MGGSFQVRLVELYEFHSCLEGWNRTPSVLGEVAKMTQEGKDKKTCIPKHPQTNNNVYSNP